MIEIQNTSSMIFIDVGLEFKTQVRLLLASLIQFQTLSSIRSINFKYKLNSV